MDVYDLIVLFMSWAPGIGPPLVAFCAAVGALMAAASSVVAIGRTVVKLTFWTKKDDEALAKFEKWFEKITDGPLKPLFEVIDRLSVLKNVKR